MGSRVPLMRAVHRRELDRVTHEESRLGDMTLSVTVRALVLKSTTHRVVEHPVQVSFIRVQLHRPSVNIPRGIRRATLGPNGGNTKQDIGFLANGVQEACGCDVGAVVGAFEDTVCSERISIKQVYGRIEVRTRLLWRVPLCVYKLMVSHWSRSKVTHQVLTFRGFSPGRNVPGSQSIAYPEGGPVHHDH